MKGFRKISSAVLLVLYAIFFVSTNLCVHSHDILGEHIVHSHLGGGAHHSHSTGQIQTINFLNAESFTSAEALCEVSGPGIRSCECTTICECSIILSSKSESHCLRAPPYFA